MVKREGLVFGFGGQRFAKKEKYRETNPSEHDQQHSTAKLLVLLNKRNCLLDCSRVVTEYPHPLHIHLSPKPRHLPFRVIAMGLLHGTDRVLLVDFAFQQLHSLLVADGIE